MLVSGVEFIPLNWSRSTRTEDESIACEMAFSEVLGFLLSMEEKARIYASKKKQNALRDVVSLIVLNVIDGHVLNRPLLLSSRSFPDEGIAPWSMVSTAAHALEVKNHCTLWNLSADGDEFLLGVAGPLANKAPKLKAAILNHSQPFDVHRWSEHPESNAFVDAIYEQHFDGGNAGIRKKPLKVVLLDLYVRWSLDPTLKTGVSLNVNSYEARSRYNAIHISKITIEIVKHLVRVGLLHLVKGFNDPVTPENSRHARIWPTEKLTDLFAEARFGLLDIGQHPDREVIILRDDDKKDIGYDDNDETNAMRKRLRAYNELIGRTFVDIPTLETSFIELDGHCLPVSQADKFTRRVFNRGAFTKGGRFYGGWWQRCPEHHRMGIFLNDEPTLEADYSGLHMVMLYANKGIDWTEIGGDPYGLSVPEFGAEESRAICKLLALVALNAKDETTAFQAFRSEAEPDSKEKGMSNGRLRTVLDGLRVKHAPIADMFANDAGIDLMNQDGQITDKILTAFTQAGIPILSIHDSYIVAVRHWLKLDVEMQRAFVEVTGLANVRVKPSRYLHPGNTMIGPVPSVPRRLTLNADDGLTPQFGWQSGNDLLFPWANPVRSQRYANDFAAFRNWQDKLA